MALALGTDVESELRAARARGRAEAVELDSRLRTLEREEREQRLDRTATGEPSAARGQGSFDATLQRLRREEEHLSSYRNAVLASTPWRAAELVRGWVGRSWTPRGEGGAPTAAPRSPEATATHRVAAHSARKAELEALESRVEELAAFVDAVARSRTWRVIQAMRRLAGREW